jgi:transposase
MADDRGWQDALLPVSVHDLLPVGHLVWDVLAMVEELDLSAFQAAYRADGRGRPPFHPRMMVALILYCRCKGIMSGRDVSAACVDDLGARIIMGGQRPNRSTVDRFVRVHCGALKALLPQTLRIGHVEGLVDVSVVAGDGSKLLANAAMGATVDEATLLAQIDDLEAHLDRATAVWDEAVGTENAGPPALPGIDERPDAARRGVRSDKLWDRVSRVGVLLRRRRAALAHLRTHPNADVMQWQDKLTRDQSRVVRNIERLAHVRGDVQAAHDRRRAAEANGTKIPGTRPVPVDEHIEVKRAAKALAAAKARAEATATARPTTARVNTTDHHSRIMPGKNDGFDQRHNVQALSCPSQLIIAIATHDSSNDKQALTALIHQGRANLDAAGITAPIMTALFDSGYASENNFNADLPVDLLLVAVEKEARQTERLNDGDSTAKQAWKAMATLFQDPINRKLYKRRGAIIEPIFAQLFARFGRGINARGDNVDTELHIWVAAHNLLKIVRHRRRKTRPG